MRAFEYTTPVLTMHASRKLRWGIVHPYPHPREIFIMRLINTHTLDCISVQNNSIIRTVFWFNIQKFVWNYQSHRLPKTTPQIMLDTALATSSWQLNGFPSYFIISLVSTSISSMHLPSIVDFPTPKSRMPDIANLRVVCQPWRLFIIPKMKE